MTDLVKDEFKKWLTKYTEGFDIEGEYLDDIVDVYIKNNNRVFYDFYDENRIYLTISHGDNEFWAIIFFGNGSSHIHGTNKTRIEAEKVGFEKCAELLNERLCLKEK